MDRAALRLAWAAAPDRGTRREVSRRMLHGLLTAVGADDAVIEQRCDRCGARTHGPLRLIDAPWLVSASYAGPLAVVALLPRAGGVDALGLDAEPHVDAVRDAAGLRGVVAGGLAQWVRVEATLKADGRGVAVPPHAVELTTEASGWTARVPGVREPFRGWEPDGPPGVLVSVAVREAAGAPSRRATG